MSFTVQINNIVHYPIVCLKCLKKQGDLVFIQKSKEIEIHASPEFQQDITAIIHLKKYLVFCKTCKIFFEVVLTKIEEQPDANIKTV